QQQQNIAAADEPAPKQPSDESENSVVVEGDLFSPNTINDRISGKNDDNLDDFGDFGSAQDINNNTTTLGVEGRRNNDLFEDDGFGAFDTATTTAAITTQMSAPSNDDDDFGDFGEVQAAGNDNDGFGDFNDFADGDGFQTADGDDDFGSFESVEDGNPFGEPVQIQVSAPVPTPAPVAEEAPVVIAPDFTAVNSLQVENYVLEKLSELYPIEDDDNHGNYSAPSLLNTDMEELDMASLLAEQELWTSLCEQSFQIHDNISTHHHYHHHHRQQQQNNNRNSSTEYPTSPLAKSSSPSSQAAPQFQWKHSNLRKEYYASLGLVVAKEQTVVTPSSIPNSLNNISLARSRVSSPMIVSTETMPERKPIDIAAVQAYCQFTP
ncbi:hypothetical protein BX616_007667, partial [Lobosporangium transversale]